MREIALAILKKKQAQAEAAPAEDFSDELSDTDSLLFDDPAEAEADPKADRKKMLAGIMSTLRANRKSN